MSKIDPPAGWPDVDGIDPFERLLGGPLPTSPINRSIGNLTARSKQLRAEKVDTAALAAASGAESVGWRAAGVGAVSTTVSSKLQQLEVSPYDFGYTDGMADGQPSIQRAIDSLPARGGIVRLPLGQVNLAAPLLLGNGNGAGTPSTKNGIKLIGAGGGFAAPFSTLPTFLNYTGPSGMGPVIQLQGQISDCHLEGFHLALNGNAAGIYMRSFSGCRVVEVKITNPAPDAAALTIVGGGAPTGNYNIYNTFNTISIGLFQPNSIGLFCDGDYAAVNDTWLTKFELVRIETVAGATGATCAWMKFIDSVTFMRCHIDSKPEPTSNGLILDATGNPGFLNNYPIGLSYYDCSISKIDVVEDSLSKIGPCYFFGHGANDHEVLPSHPRLFGITANGETFGWLSGFKQRRNQDVVVQNSSATVSVFSYSVGSYFLGGGDSFRPKNGGLSVRHFGQYVNVSGGDALFTLEIRFGGALLFSAPFTVPSGTGAHAVSCSFSIVLINDSSSAQVGNFTAVMGADGSVQGVAAAPLAVLYATNSSPGLSIDTSVAQTLDVSVRHGTASSSLAYTAKSTVLDLT